VHSYNPLPSPWWGIKKKPVKGTNTYGKQKEHALAPAPGIIHDF